MTSQTQYWKTTKKMKVQYLRGLLFDLFETLQAVRTWQRNSASFQILLLWQPESKLEKCHFLPGGGLLKIGGNQVFFLDRKGDQKIFSNRKGGITYIF